jgi:hypothetical protein
MNALLALAQFTRLFAESAVAWPVTDLLGSLGAASAAVCVTYCFLNFLRNQEERQKQILVQFDEIQKEAQRKFQEQLDRLADLREASQHNFQEQIGRLTESHNLILRESIVAMKSIEKTTERSTATTREIQKTIDSLHVAVRMIDTVVRRLIDVRGSADPAPARPR